LNAADRLRNFLDGIDAYVNAKNITPTPFNAEFAIAETFTLEQMQKLIQDECFNYAYLLYQYADHISHERANCENVIKWCDYNLQSIIAEDLKNGVWEQYAKHETKVATILRDNEVAFKIHEWKMTAEGRLENVKNREYNIRRKADILIEKGKKR
jgi:hypothetical protein